MRHAIVSVALILATAITLSAAPASGQEEVARQQPLAAELTQEERMAADVQAALTTHFGDDAAEILVQVAANRAILTGVAPLKPVQELAKEVALAVPGITQVSNFIEVRPRPASPDTPVAATVARAEREVSDSALESRVKMRITSLLGVRARQVEVEACQGWVSLRGVLPDADTKAMVVRVAENTPGVGRLIDLLRHP